MSVVSDFGIDTNPDAFGSFFGAVAVPGGPAAGSGPALGWSYDTPYAGPNVPYNPDTGHLIHWDVGDWNDPNLT